MIYAISIMASSCLAWVYDVMEYPKGKWSWYYLLLFWFIIISGFQYMVGSDMPVYVDEYNNYYDTLRFDVGSSVVEGKRQPGWVLLSCLCRMITHDFLLFKLIHAIFVNYAIFTFFKKESQKSGQEGRRKRPWAPSRSSTELQLSTEQLSVKKTETSRKDVLQLKTERRNYSEIGRRGRLSVQSSPTPPGG